MKTMQNGNFHRTIYDIRNSNARVQDGNCKLKNKHFFVVVVVFSLQDKREMK